MEQQVLVADIGGTNARFSLAYIDDEKNIKIDGFRSYLTDNWIYMEDAVADYLSEMGQKPQCAAIAFAGPVNNDDVSMTNGSWNFKQSELAQALRMREVKVLNDFVAKACSIPLLPADSLIKIGGGFEKPKGNKIAVGPGTGLGSGALIAVKNQWKPVACESGHVGFSPSGKLEKEIFKIICNGYLRVSAENILSGSGITHIYKALGEINGLYLTGLPPYEISRKAFQENDANSIQALEVYSGMLGRFAGDMAGTFNATGGVYLDGGVLLKIKDIFLKSDFRNKFEENTALPFLKDISTYLIDHEYSALYGAAGYYSGKFL